MTSQKLIEQKILEIAKTDRLTRKETMVLKDVVNGLSNAKIGNKYNLQRITIRNKVTNILAKTGYHTRTELIIGLFYGILKTMNYKPVLKQKIADIAKTYHLTTLDTEILTDLLTGLSVQESSQKYFFTPSTIRSHILQIVTKLGYDGKSRLVFIKDVLSDVLETLIKQ